MPLQTVLTVIGFIAAGCLTLVLILLLVRYYFFCKSHKNVPGMETVRERLLAVNRQPEPDVDIITSVRTYLSRRRYRKAYNRVQKERSVKIRKAAQSLWY